MTGPSRDISQWQTPVSPYSLVLIERFNFDVDKSVINLQLKSLGDTQKVFELKFFDVAFYRVGARCLMESEYISKVDTLGPTLNDAYAPWATELWRQHGNFVGSYVSYSHYVVVGVNFIVEVITRETPEVS